MTEVRRILVALDASPHSQAALRAAAELAAELKAELLGVFVEDINLLRLAALPGAEEVVSALGRARALDPVRLERALRLQAAELRRALESVAAETHVRWAFRVTRGRVVNELLSAAHEADMLVLGRIGRSLARRTALGATAQAVAATASRTVVFIEHGVRLGQPVVVLFDGTDTALRALATAARLAREDSANLIVLIPTAEPDKCKHLQDEAANWLREHHHRAGIQCMVIGKGVTGLAHAVQQKKGGTLVLPADHLLVQEKTLADLMNRIRCPLVLVR